MVHSELAQDYQDYYEYHGNTEVEHIRKHAGTVVWRDWIMFNSVEEAQDYFHNDCCS